jgi:nitrate reductase (NAD(P)H)
MGMMNNTIFRIKLHRMKNAGGDDMIWCEHPTMPGAETGGWMTDDAGKYDPNIASEASPGRNGIPPNRTVAAVWKGAGEDALTAGTKAAEKLTSVKDKKPETAGKLVTSKPEWLSKGITMTEVERHNNDSSAWFVVNNRVYDGTPYLKEHPGGRSSILIAAGQEASDDFEATHSAKAWIQLEDYYLGPLAPESSLVRQNSPLPSAVSPGSFLNKAWQQFPLVEKIIVSSDTRIFRFGLPAPDMRLGLPTGGHIFLKARIDGELVMRPYSPMTDDETIGHVDLLVKVYRAGVHPAFPNGGKLSQYLDSLKIGDLLDVKGPTGEFIYKGKGKFTWQDEPRSCKCINMIAGGTGLTPCYQVLNAVLRDPTDTTNVNLLYANRSPDDILAKETLDQLAAAHPDRFKLTYTVDKQPSEPWNGRVGFINKAMIVEDLLPASDDTIVVMCGPPVMIEKACHPNLKAAGFQDIHIYEF